MQPTIQTERLVIRPWHDDDAADALAIYGNADAAHPVRDVVSMRSLLQSWQQKSDDPSPVRYWAIEHHDTRWLVGAIALLPLPGERLSVAWRLAPAARGRGFAGEALAGLLHLVLDRGVLAGEDPLPY